MINAKEHTSLLAERIRRKLGYDPLGSISLTDLCDREPNLTIVERPLSENTSGMCIKTGHERGLIAINSTMVWGRQRFTLAHELYHFYFSEDVSVICTGDEEYDKNPEERRANEFARYFLMPDQTCYAIFEETCQGEMSLDTILKMEHFFQVSRRAMLAKLCQLRLLDASHKEVFMQNITARASEKGYPKALYQVPCSTAPTTYGKYIALVSELYEKGIISSQKREELLLDAHREDMVFSENGKQKP